MLFFSSCQKDEIESSTYQNTLTSTHLRHDGPCEDCDEIIVNGSFDQHCPDNWPFVDQDCVDGPWFRASATPMIQNGQMFGTWEIYTSAGNTLKLQGESIFYNEHLEEGSNYCLDFDFTFNELTNGIIEDWKVCAYASNLIPMQGFFDWNIPSPVTDPNCVQYPNILDDSFLVDCQQLTVQDDNQTLSIEFEFTPDVDYSQLWFILQPSDNINVFVGYQNGPNITLWDNFSLKCESGQLTGIGSAKNGCSYTFWAEEKPNSDVDIVSWKWDFGDGSTGVGDDITHTYTVAGDYTVTLYIEDENGCCKTEEIEVNCEIIDADYCKYICHEEYLMPGFTCAVGVLYNDHNPNTSASQPLQFTQPYEHTDFVGIANEIETELNNAGFNMLVSNYDPNGGITCYKSFCLGCDGNPIPPQFEIIDDLPTGVVSGTWTGTTSLMTGNGIPLGTTFTNPLGVNIIGTSVPVTYTIFISNNINPNTVVVTINPNGPGFILQFEDTEGIFAMGDVEILRIIGNNEFDGTSCDNADINSQTAATIPFHHCL